MSATVFDTPLDARSLIEASAGTGKTYALAGLFARAVIVGRLRVPQILAVTYTVAATQELHERVRKRLHAAAELAAHWRDGDAATHPADPSELALLRRFLCDALHDASGESLPALRLRLARAVRDMDLAVITTIHGFCQRLLAEHALDAGQPLLASDIVPANAAQRSALAVELWRQGADSPAGADFLQRWFGDLDSLAGGLRTLLSPDRLLPEAPATLPPDPRPVLDAAWRAFQTSFAAHDIQAHTLFADAMRGKVLNGSRYKLDHLDALWNWLRSVVARDTPPMDWHDKLDRYTRLALHDGCNKGQSAPDSPLCAAIADLLSARDAIGPWQEACDLQQLHALRSLARMRDAADKRALRVRDYDDLIAAVHDASVDAHTGPRLATALRAQFPLVLVDEFQDTDARQWSIFERLFGDRSAGDGGLLLVGDPKQAIYRFRGGDIETYLVAKASALAATPLLHNYRSRPCVLAAVNAVFARVPDDGLGAGIRFARAMPGRDASCDAHLLCDDIPMPAMTFHAVSPRRVVKADGAVEEKDWTKPESIRIAAELCADAVRDRLQLAAEGRAQRIENGVLRPLQPRDCAVLVRTHDEGDAVRAELARRGVPTVSAGRGSLFATPSAQSLLTLLLALASPGDDRRLRAALASPLFGLVAAGLSALEDDGVRLLRWQDDFARWRARWEQHGPQPMLAEVLARQAGRLLALADGERELTSLLQLGELMQEARAQRLGPQGQLDWLRLAIANADGDDETQQPRLESDAGRVQVLTLHASKGLEFALVFLPFVGIGRGNGSKATVVGYHQAGERVRQWKTQWPHGDTRSWPDAVSHAKTEEQAEDMRLLYVGLTRARDALWLCGGAFAGNTNTALFRLLGAATPDANMRAEMDSLLQVRDGMPGDDVVRLSPVAPAVVPSARVPQRTLRRDWWIHSFSQLHKQQSALRAPPGDERPADDERPLASFGMREGARFGGTRFGNALHDALEHVAFARWRDADGQCVPDGESTWLLDALHRQEYPRAVLADGVRELAPLIARTLNAALPVVAGRAGVRLCDVPAPARIAELEFHFTLRDADTQALLALLHAHGLVRERRDFGAWPRLSGLMNGKIDLTCQLDGRLYVVDYKSNRLPDYDPATLQQTMAASEYDLQALLYVVALHRWLRVRRGKHYDYARDFGGARYLFCRGLDVAEPGRGVAVLDFDRVLVEGVDALLAPQEETP
ncbi:MAG: recB [Xanthomonadaceae bacterium]|nr:recB [Xanthomonadaceae bacterium]